MSPFRPDLVDVWMFRSALPGPRAFGPVPVPVSVADTPTGARATEAGAPPEVGIEILLLRRAPGRILPGLWQCVSGSLEDGETVTEGALRELVEETGYGPDQIAGFYDLDQVNQFHEPSVRAIVSGAVFAVRVHEGAEPVLSHEHNAMVWAAPAEATELAIWPAYRESIRRIVENLLDPARAVWFELTLEGDRVQR